MENEISDVEDKPEKLSHEVQKYPLGLDMA